MVLSTRFEDAGFTDLIPRELNFEVYLQATDADAVVAQAGSIASGLIALLSLAVNAFVPAAEPFLAYEVCAGPDASPVLAAPRDIPTRRADPACPSRLLG